MSTDREIVMCIKKKEPAMWPRLLSESGKHNWLKVDFNRFVDEDDSDAEGKGDVDFSNMLSQMSGFDRFNADEYDGDVDSDDDGKLYRSFGVALS